MTRRQRSFGGHPVPPAQLGEVEEVEEGRAQTPYDYMDAQTPDTYRARPHNRRRRLNCTIDGEDN